MSDTLVTVITPTTGKKGLDKLIASLKDQSGDCSIEHIMLWDDARDNPSLVSSPSHYEDYTDKYRSTCIVLKGKFVFGGASGSALRAVGLMAARGKYVTFADDDVWFENNHILSLAMALDDADTNWAYARRKIWYDDKIIGIDNFESVGDSPTRKVPYEMADNNTMMFDRRFGVSAACLYRETVEYNDDRLMYKFLKDHAGPPAKLETPTVNQICPDKLVNFFKAYCDKV